MAHLAVERLPSSSSTAVCPCAISASRMFMIQYSRPAATTWAQSARRSRCLDRARRRRRQCLAAGRRAAGPRAAPTRAATSAPSRTCSRAPPTPTARMGASGRGPHAPAAWNPTPAAPARGATGATWSRGRGWRRPRARRPARAAARTAARPARLRWARPKATARGGPGAGRGCALRTQPRSPTPRPLGWRRGRRRRRRRAALAAGRARSTPRRGAGLQRPALVQARAPGL